MVKGNSRKARAFILTLRPVWSSSENKMDNQQTQNSIQCIHLTGALGITVVGVFKELTIKLLVMLLKFTNPSRWLMVLFIDI